MLGVAYLYSYFFGMLYNWQSINLLGEKNMKKEKVFFNLMIIVLIVIGIIQFFEVSKLVNYILGIIAIIFGVIGLYNKV